MWKLLLRPQFGSRLWSEGAKSPDLSNPLPAVQRFPEFDQPKSVVADTPLDSTTVVEPARYLPVGSPAVYVPPQTLHFASIRARAPSAKS